MIRIRLSSLTYLVEGEEVEQEPFLWPIFFLVDDIAVLFTLGRLLSGASREPAPIPRELIQRLPIPLESVPTLFSSTTSFFAAPGGSHGNVRPNKLTPVPGRRVGFPTTATASLSESTGILGNAAQVGILVALLEEDAIPSDEAIVSSYTGEFTPAVLTRLTHSIEKAIKAFGAKPASVKRSLSQYVVVRGTGGTLVLTESGFLRTPRARELTASASAPKASGTPSLVDLGVGYPLVIYRGLEGGIFRIWALRSGWVHDQLRLPPADSSRFSPNSDFHVWSQAGWFFIVYRAGGQLVQMKRNDATGETLTRSLSTTTPGFPRRLRVVRGDISGYQTSGGRRLILVNPEGVMSSLRMVDLDSWSFEGLPSGIPVPELAPVGIAVDEREFILYATAEGDVIELSREDRASAWRHQLLTSDAKAANRAKGSVSIARFPLPLAADGLWVAAWRTESGLCVAERIGKEVILHALDAFPGAAGDPIVTTETYGDIFERPLGIIWVEYTGMDFGLHRLVCTDGLPEFSHTDLSAIVLASAPATGDPSAIRSEILGRLEDAFGEFGPIDDVIDAAMIMRPISSIPLGRSVALTIPLSHPSEGSWDLRAVITRT